MGQHDRDANHDDTKYHVKITVHHDDDHTAAKAHLHWRYADLVGLGEAEVDPDDHYPRRVGEELAVARALTHLTRQLFVTTAGDITSVTGEDVSVR
jgi:hypothetical protein